MKKILCLIIFLPFLCISCSDNNDPSTEEEPEVELIFNEPLFMFGSSMEEVRRMEKREVCDTTGWRNLNDTESNFENTLYYTESKNGLKYDIIYSFYKDKLYLMSIKFVPSSFHAESVCSSLNEKYKLNDTGIYQHEDYSIKRYFHDYGGALIYYPNVGVEGVPPYAELVFDEPLFMFGSSMEEVKRAETRKQESSYGYLPIGENELCYKESKNGFESYILYSFYNDKLFVISVDFITTNPSAEIYHFLLDERYAMNDKGVYYHENYSLRRLDTTGTYLIYHANTPAEGLPVYTDAMFNEPLIMYGASKEQVRQAETREEIRTHPIYGDASENILWYKETKNGLEYIIMYAFYNDILRRVGLDFTDQVTIGLYDFVCSFLAEKYGIKKIRRPYDSENYYIIDNINYQSIILIYVAKFDIEGIPPYLDL